MNWGNFRNMTTVTFTSNLNRHVSCPHRKADGDTVAQVLDSIFRDNPFLREYVLDDQGALRKHMVVFLDGIAISDRLLLSDKVQSADSEIFVMQALSGG